MIEARGHWYGTGPIGRPPLARDVYSDDELVARITVEDRSDNPAAVVSVYSVEVRYADTWQPCGFEVASFEEAMEIIRGYVQVRDYVAKSIHRRFGDRPVVPRELQEAVEQMAKELIQQEVTVLSDKNDKNALTVQITRKIVIPS